MSVRRRAVQIRVERTRAFDEAWERSVKHLRLIQSIIETAIADRDGHRRLDADGAPPLPEPRDPYEELVRETIRLSNAQTVGAEHGD